MPPVGMTRHAANAVTALRLALAPVFVWSVSARAGGGWVAALLFALIASSDYFDGRIARRLAIATPAGRWLDHLADIGFILVALGFYAWLGVAPWWAPAAIAASFATYVADSWRRTAAGGSPQLLGSRLGHVGGILNYTLIGILVGNDTVGLGWLPAWLVFACFCLVPLYSGASVAARLRR